MQSLLIYIIHDHFRHTCMQHFPYSQVMLYMLNTGYPILEVCKMCSFKCQHQPLYMAQIVPESLRL